MDAKKLAMVLGIAVLLPLFLVFFVDAIYAEPKWDDYCKNSMMYATPYKEAKPNITCQDFYSLNESRTCSNNEGMPQFKYDENNCQVFDSCDYCQRDYNNVQQLYNRNIFFILAPLGLVIVLIGIYLTIDYIGAGLMFGGLITMFYATVRYFTDMSKLLRAIVLLIELVIIMYIGYKKIGDGKNESTTVSKKIIKSPNKSSDKSSDKLSTNRKTRGKK